MRQVWVCNQCPKLPTAALYAMTEAIAHALTRDFDPVFHTEVVLNTMTCPDHLPVMNADREVIRIINDDAHADFLGYHRFDGSGFPSGFVLAAECQYDPKIICATLDHELKEQLCNPLARGCMLVQLPAWWGGLAGRSALVPFEVCDPVEEDTYDHEGWPMSNFVKPLWFTEVEGGSRLSYDYLGNLAGPLRVSNGGYYNVSLDMSEWQEFGVRGRQKGFRSRHSAVRGRLLRG